MLLMIWFLAGRSRRLLTHCVFSGLREYQFYWASVASSPDSLVFKLQGEPSQPSPDILWPMGHRKRCIDYVQCSDINIAVAIRPVPASWYYGDPVGLGPPGPYNNGNMGTPSYVWGPLTKSRRHISVHARACAWLLYRYLWTSRFFHFIGWNLHIIYQRWKIPQQFFKVDKQALRKRAKFFMVKGTQLYYVGGGRYNYSNAAAYNMLIAYDIIQACNI